MCKFRENKFQNFFEKWTFINVLFYIFLAFYKILKITFKKTGLRPLRCKFIIFIIKNS